MKLEYPNEFSDNLVYRSKIIEKMKVDREFAFMIKEVCRRDIKYWFNVFCWLNEPNVRKRRIGKIPFITYRFQDKTITELCLRIDRGQDLVIEKSRDMGATWLILLTFQWYWLFGDTGNDFLVGSINSAKTDTLGVLDTLFQKLRYNLYLQPDIFVPNGFSQQIHDGHMKLINPETKSYIRGDSNTYFATSGRYKAIFFDEFAKWPHKEDRIGWQSASDSSPCKIAVSSANGRNNLFYELRSGKHGDIKLIRLYWREHPLKDTRWYEREKKRRSKQDLAAEVDIDYLASVGNRAAENWNYDTHVRKVEHNLDFPLELNCDFNINPMCWVVSHTIKGHRYTFREYVMETTITEKVITNFCEDFAKHRLKQVILFGDASGKYGTTNSRYSDWDIIKKILKANGWTVFDRIPLKNPSHIDRMNVVNKRLKDYENHDKSWETVSYDCPKLIESIESTERSDNNIVKNNLEHLFDSWSYGLCMDYPVVERKIYQIKRA
jgi:hypothetical protein